MSNSSRRILFVTENEISPLQGGTERITGTLSRAFERRGYSCILAYCRPCDLPEKTEFEGKVLLRRGSEKDLLQGALTGVDYVICNLVDIKYKRRLLPLLYSLTRGTATMIYACYHAMPGEELIGNTLKNSFYHLWHGDKVSAQLRDIVLRLTPRSVLMALKGRYIRSRYNLMYDYSDRVVLLSQRFYEPFARLAGRQVDEHLSRVNSALSYEFEPIDMASKRREILIVSRLDEKPKRLSRALKIWSKVSHNGWKLIIVGGGPDAEYYRQMALRLHLTDVQFEGRVPDIREYYRRASIFMMTSEYEGWGLTLTEAQQYGVVPIAYDTYASLRDIITDGENGVIVPKGRSRVYVRRLQSLMNRDSERERMARRAMESCQRYEVGRIVDQWLAIFDDKGARA